MLLSLYMKKSVVGCIVLAGLMLGGTIHAQEADGPDAIVDLLHTKLLEVMKNAGELDYTARYKILEPVIASHFDTPLIAKVILSRQWDELSDEKRNEFIELFNQLSTATYASRFDSYDGEEFNIIKSEELKKGRLLLKTELTRNNKKPVNLDYLMHKNNEHWMIISVIADGVNDLSLKRAEYAAVIRDKGYDGLLDDIRSKIRDMENEV